MKQCRDNTTSKSEANVDSEVIMDETKTKIEIENEIKELVNKWELQDRGCGLSDNNRDIIKSLQAFNSPENKSEEGTASKKYKTSHESETSNDSTMTCWELVFFLVRHCKTNERFSFFEVTYSESGFQEKATLEKYDAENSNFENFEDKLMAARKAGKTMEKFFFQFKDEVVFFSPKHFSVEEQLKRYRILFVEKEQIRAALDGLFEKIQTDYCENLVSDEEQMKAEFSEDTRKAAAIVVTGESGSGKTSFAKQFLPRKFKDASFIYREIGTKEKKNYEKRLTKGNNDKWKRNQARLKTMITAMREHDFDAYGIAYDTVAEISRKQNKERNDHARNFLDDLIEAEMERDCLREWWASHTLRIKQLVIIIDEIGKLPDLARGLVDEVRIISQQYKETQADEVLIVLVGSGLDGLIEEDSIPFDCMDIGDESADSRAFLESLKGFGTDPSKLEIINLKSPKLVPGETISKISVNTIQKGSYSKVLATNSRMLFNGVIPIMKSKFHTLNVDTIDLDSRLEQIGSTNIIMDYAARVYSTLNGLKDCKPDVSRSLLLQQFIFLQRAELCHNADKINPATTEAINEAKKLNNSIAYTICLSMGIITSDVISTSKALRYLACEGSTAPLDAADGIGFEIVLQHHLYCLSRAMYFLPLQSSSDNKPSSDGNEAYICRQYTLKEAWPPRSTAKMGPVGPVAHAKSRMKRKNRDIDSIANIVAKRTDCDLVMRQAVSNAQGADVIVLSKRGKVIFLDLYQTKHLGKIPGPKTREVARAFSSLGVLYNYEEGKDCFNTDPKQGSAGYSNECTRILTIKLEAKLNVKVEIRNRVVVYSRKGKLDSKSSLWKDFPFKEASEKRLWIWTGDFLEPTISALCISGAE